MRLLQETMCEPFLFGQRQAIVINGQAGPIDDARQRLPARKGLLRSCGASSMPSSSPRGPGLQDRSTDQSTSRIGQVRSMAARRDLRLGHQFCAARLHCGSAVISGAPRRHSRSPAAPACRIRSHRRRWRHGAPRCSPTTCTMCGLSAICTYTLAARCARAASRSSG